LFGKSLVAQITESDTLSNFTHPPALRLRSIPLDNLSWKVVVKMLTEKDFYDPNGNKKGKGLRHRYQRQGDIIIDFATGLMWQQSGSEYEMVWENAQKEVDRLNRKKFAGYDDWRLPTLEEAMSLMEPARKNGGLYIDPIFDKQRWIWTADRKSGSLAWHVFFDNGFCDIWHVKNAFTYVRAVRSRQSAMNSSSSMSAQSEKEKNIHYLNLLREKLPQLEAYVAILTGDKTNNGTDKRIDARVKLKLLEAEIRDVDNNLYNKYQWTSTNRKAWIDFYIEALNMIRKCATKAEYFQARKKEEVLYENTKQRHGEIYYYQRWVASSEIVFLAI
jgi:hypothetical protein